jgi:tetratricopeptide repeat protein 30
MPMQGLGNSTCRLTLSYEQLMRSFPEMEEYKLYYAQCLYLCGDYEGSEKICFSIQSSGLKEKVTKLLLSIKYDTNDVAGCKQCLEKLPKEDTDAMMNQGSLLFKVILCFC